MCIKRLIIFLAVVCSVSYGQSVSPFTVTPGSGQSPTSMFDVSPATTANPCKTLAQMPASFSPVARLCIQNGLVYIDNGNGYGSQQGPKGDTGAAGKDGKDGAPGKDGVNGKDGATGAPGKDAPFPFTIVCSGKLIADSSGHLSVSNMICNPFTIP